MIFSLFRAGSVSGRGQWSLTGRGHDFDPFQDPLKQAILTPKKGHFRGQNRPFQTSMLAEEPQDDL